MSHTAKISIILKWFKNFWLHLLFQNRSYSFLLRQINIFVFTYFKHAWESAGAKVSRLTCGKCKNTICMRFCILNGQAYQGKLPYNVYGWFAVMAHDERWIKHISYCSFNYLIWRFRKKMFHTKSFFLHWEWGCHFVFYVCNFKFWIYYSVHSNIFYLPYRVVWE